MSSDFSALDLATLSTAEKLIVAAIYSQAIQWEQDSADAAAAGRCGTAQVLRHWADAAELLAFMVTTECSGFFGKAVDARYEVKGCGSRSGRDPMLEDLAIEVAGA